MWYVHPSFVVAATKVLRFHRNGSPIIITLVSLWHFAVYRGQVLTPSVAFTAISGGLVLFEDLINIIPNFSRFKYFRR